MYDGNDCLNTVQISALLALDTRRALDRAASSVKSLDEQCCPVMAVFGDIQHSAEGRFSIWLRADKTSLITYSDIESMQIRSE